MSKRSVNLVKSTSTQLSSLPDDYEDEDYSEDDPAGSQDVENAVIPSDDDEYNQQGSVPGKNEIEDDYEEVSLLPPATPINQRLANVKMTPNKQKSVLKSTDPRIQQRILDDIYKKRDNTPFVRRPLPTTVDIMDWNTLSRDDQLACINMYGRPGITREEFIKDIS